MDTFSEGRDLFCICSISFPVNFFRVKIYIFFHLRMQLISTSLDYLKLNEYVNVYIDLLFWHLQPKIA